MIGVQPQFIRAPDPQLNGGPGIATRAIGILALSIISAFVSFAFLPWQAAFLVSGSLTALFSMCWCCPREEQRGDGVVQERWYQPFFNAMPGFVRHLGHPVFNPGPRVDVGPHFNAQPPDPRAGAFAQPAAPIAQARVPVGHENRYGGVAVLPPAMAPAHQAAAAIPAAFHAAHNANPVNRVPVGHG